MKIGVWRLPAARRRLALSREDMAVTAFATNSNASDMSSKATDGTGYIVNSPS